MTLSEAYSFGTELLTKSGIEDAKLDAALLLEGICGVNRGYLLAHKEQELSLICDSQDKYIEAIHKRSERIPLQHILEHTSFMGLEFEVTSDALIPRADTEILVEEAMREVHDGMDILDMCTGSGCILISLLNYSNACYGVGTDISPRALQLAGKNADNILKCRTDITYNFVESDIFDKVEGLFDVIVSNPPYICTKTIGELEPEVKDYDPLIALDGGEDGLYFYRRIINEAVNHLKLGGSILFEIGCEQATAVSRLLQDGGFDNIEIVKDYAGLDRVVKARRKICLTN